ncbi:MAG: AraC family transcriptional regulator [Clostridia bacterium]|nr:AraC family transcriptional regulator [Clostridia bacterium]
MSKVYKYISLPPDFPFSIKFAEMEPYYCMGHTFHWHNYLEISYVKQGKGRYYIENKTYDIQEGDIVVINNIEPHYMEVLPPDRMLQPVVMFDPKLVWSNEGQLFDFQYLKPFFDRSSNFSNKIDSKSDIGKKIFQLLAEIEEEYTRQPVGYKLMIKAKLLHIITYLIRHFQDSEKQLESISSKSSKLKKLESVFEYINLNYSRRITLEDLSSLVFMSPNYFCSFFKDSTGFTPVEYLNKIRISKAVEYLKTTDKGVYDISLNCGFSNLANFNKMFKRFTGLTPSRVRRQ